jgi:flagellar hook-associated protein 3 FlgL
MINITDQIMFNLGNLNKENLRVNYQLSTGKILQKGSDDGAVFTKELYFDDKIRVYGGVHEQIKRAMTLNDSVDSTLANVKLELDVIKNSMLKTLNAGMQQSDKLAVATQLEGIKENFFTWANTNINNEYIFAGSNSTKQPFEKDANGKITYVGDNVLKQVPVEPNSYRDRGVTGFDAFMYTSDTAKVGEPLEFLASERIVDNEGNTWAFPQSSGVGEKLDFFATDTITDNNGTTWTLNALDAKLEDGNGASLDLVKFNGGYQFKSNLSNGFEDGLGASVTSFTSTSATAPALEVRQYDRYGNLTGEKLAVTEIDNGDGIADGGDDTGLLEPKYRTANVTDASLILESKHNMFNDLDDIITTLNGKSLSDGVTPITEAEQNEIIRSMLDKVKATFDAVNIAHSKVGSRNKIIEDASVNISAKITNFNILSLENGQANLSKVAMEAKSLELTYTALYSTVSRMHSLNLVNFLK